MTEKKQKLLLVELAADSLRIGRLGAEGTDILTLMSIPFSISGESYLKHLEEAVYGNELLLNTDATIHVVVDSQDFALLPQGLAPELEHLTVESLHLRHGDDYVECQAPQSAHKIAFTLPTGVGGFLRRTFAMPIIHHHLWGAMEHHVVSDLKTGGNPMLHVNLRKDGIIDLVATSRGKLTLATGHTFRTVTDALYHTIHAWKLLNLDALNHALHYAGDSQLVGEFVPRVKEYLNQVEAEPESEIRINTKDVDAALFHNLILTAEQLCE